MHEWGSCESGFITRKIVRFLSFSCRFSVTFPHMCSYTPAHTRTLRHVPHASISTGEWQKPIVLELFLREEPLYSPSLTCPILGCHTQNFPQAFVMRGQPPIFIAMRGSACGPTSPGVFCTEFPVTIIVLTNCRSSWGGGKHNGWEGVRMLQWVGWHVPLRLVHLW